MPAPVLCPRCRNHVWEVCVDGLCPFRPSATAERQREQEAQAARPTPSEGFEERFVSPSLSMWGEA